MAKIRFVSTIPVKPSSPMPGWRLVATRTRSLQVSCVRRATCFERTAAFSLPLLLKKGGEGRGEEALFISFPFLRLSPRSFLVGRERQNAASVLRAEQKCLQVY